MLSLDELIFPDIAVVVAVVELFERAVTVPGLEGEVVSLLATVVQRPCVDVETGCEDLIVRNCEDDLGRSSVVGLEVIEEVARECEATAVHNFVQSRQRVVVASLSGVFLGVHVKVRQNCLRRVEIHPGVSRTTYGLVEVVHRAKQTLFYKSENFRRAVVLGSETGGNVEIVHNRNITEHIQQLGIEEGTQSGQFRFGRSTFRATVGSDHTELLELEQQTVTGIHTSEVEVPGTVHERIVGNVGVQVQTTPVTTVVPVITTGRNYYLIGGYFLNREGVAHVTVQAGVGSTEGTDDLLLRLEEVICFDLAVDLGFEVRTGLVDTDQQQTGKCIFANFRKIHTDMMIIKINGIRKS